MRGRMSPATNYTKGVGIGEVMQGGSVGEVVASNHPAWKVGDIAESMSVGWQEWSLSSGDELPHIFTRKSRPRPKEFLISSAKRLLQQNLP